MIEVSFRHATSHSSLRRAGQRIVTSKPLSWKYCDWPCTKPSAIAEFTAITNRRGSELIFIFDPRASEGGMEYHQTGKTIANIAKNPAEGIRPHVPAASSE